MWIEHTQPPEREMKTAEAHNLPLCGKAHSDVRKIQQCPLCREWSLEVVIIDGKPHYECACGYRS